MEPQLEAEPTKPSGSSSRTILRIPRRSRGSGARKVVVVDTRSLEERVAARKQELLVQKRRELAKVLDKHDDLVREAFHLERFVTLVSFDPEIAKTDTSSVFEAFRAKYDLVANSLPGSSAVGSSGRRTTRRAVNDRRQSLGAVGLANESFESSPTSSFRKGKGKGREHPPTTNGTESPRKPLDLQLLSPSMPPPRGRKASRQSLPALPPPAAPVEEETTTTPQRPAQSRRPRLRSLMVPPKTQPHVEAPIEGSVSSMQAEGGPVPPQPSPARKARKKKADVPPLQPPPIKRVRLVHRVPSPTFTHPDQRPPPPSFSGQLSAYLRSYVKFEDEGPDLVPEQLEQAAHTDAGYLLRISELRGEGRLSNPKGAGPSNPEPSRPRGHWDEVVEGAIAASKASREAGRLRMNGARRVARIITAHWEKAAGADDKQKRAEEKRMLTVVKATLKAVLVQWKDAVKFVRLKKAEEVKAEQARRGKQHLDAIIEHSTQAFRAQRARHSRSTSQGTSSLRHDSDTSSVDDGSEPERDSDNEESDDEGDGEDQSVVGVHMDLDVYDEDPSVVENAVEESTVALGSEVMSPYISPSHSSSPSPRLNGLSRQTSVTETPDRVPSVVGRRVSFRDPDIKVEDPTSLSPSDSSAAHADETRMNENPMEVDLEAEVVDAASKTSPNSEHRKGNGRSSQLVTHSRGYRLSPSTTATAPGAEPDFIDTDFEANPDEEAEDLELAVKMEEEESESDDGELNALEQEAELPLEELLRQYGYVPASGGDQGDSDHEEGPETPEAPSDHDEVPELPEELASGSGKDVEVPRSNSAQMVTSPTPTFSAARTRSPSPDITTSASPKNSPMANGHVSSSPAPDEMNHAGEDTSMNEIILQPSSTSDDPETIKQPFLLRGTLRPYQQAGLEWLISLYFNNHNGILADEMGLGKTIQTISLLAYLACEKGNWGPHLIIVPTSVLKNWEMEFKKFLPGFKIITYYGSAKERKERRHGWKAPNAFNVCITSYQLILADQHIFRRMPWVYMILDEAHNIKNFKSQRWQDLFTFRPARRLLLTGTPLQNNLMELWALMHFLNPVETVGYRSDFADWFSKPMDKAIEDGRAMDVETQDRVNKLHILLRPYLLRRMKADVEKELPGKFEHLVYCRLSKRQRFLYDEFMARAETKEILASGNFLSVVNCLMQLRKVCNHPDLFEVRPIVTSFVMSKSAVADFEIKELLVRRRLLASSPFDTMHHVLATITSHEDASFIASRSRRFLDASSRLQQIQDLPGEPPPHDIRTIAGFRRYNEYCLREEKRAAWRRISYINRTRCAATPIYGLEKLACVRKLYKPLLPLEIAECSRRDYLDRNDLVHGIIKSYAGRAQDMKKSIDHFAFATPVAVALDLPSQALRGAEGSIHELQFDTEFDTLHTAAVKLQIAFPDAYLLQYDCGKLQELDTLLKERRAGGHRVLIFTQMTKVLDVLEIFLNLHGYRYLRLDGSTKIEDRQKITQRFNMDTRVLAFISSSRSGGVGINLTGADTVIFYDSDYNPSMDRQCEDRAHRIGQIRDVHIYRFISKHTVEESMLRKANQKRSLDDIVIRQGEFDWRKVMVSDLQMVQALEQVEDVEDAQAARNAAAEMYMDTAGEQQEFDESAGPVGGISAGAAIGVGDVAMDDEAAEEEEDEDELEVLGLSPLEKYMVRFVERDWDFFSDWRVK